MDAEWCRWDEPLSSSTYHNLWFVAGILETTDHFSDLRISNFGNWFPQTAISLLSNYLMMTCPRSLARMLSTSGLPQNLKNRNKKQIGNICEFWTKIYWWRVTSGWRAILQQCFLFYLLLSCEGVRQPASWVEDVIGILALKIGNCENWQYPNQTTLTWLRHACFSS